MKSDVYFIEFGSTGKKRFLEKIDKVLQDMKLNKFIREDAIVGIKMHFGEAGNTTFIPPVYIRHLIDIFKRYKWKMFLTDTNVIYRGRRKNAIEHLILAAEHGYSYTTMGIPVIISDGVRSESFTEVEIDGEIYKRVKVAGGIASCEGLIVVSHFKGHIVAGFGGALKNLGMGCVSKQQKYEMHSTVKPKVKREKCTGCKICVRWCIYNAIIIKEGKAEIQENICTGCAECIAECPVNAIRIPWDEDKNFFQKKMVESAKGVIKVLKNKLLYINFLINITPDCDCMTYSDKPLVPDIGVLISFDPVAIDQASFDLVKQKEGCKGTRAKEKIKSGDDKFKAVYPSVDSQIQLEHAEKIGLGSREYKLIKL